MTSDRKTALETRLKELRAQVADYEGDLRASHSSNWTERATEMEGEEVLEGLENAALREIKQIETALQRIEHGQDGLCDMCNGEIEAARLAALPSTTRCIACAGIADEG